MRPYAQIYLREHFLEQYFSALRVFHASSFDISWKSQPLRLPDYQRRLFVDRIRVSDKPSSKQRGEQGRGSSSRKRDILDSRTVARNIYLSTTHRVQII